MQDGHFEVSLSLSLSLSPPPDFRYLERAWMKQPFGQVACDARPAARPHSLHLVSPRNTPWVVEMIERIRQPPTRQQSLSFAIPERGCTLQFRTRSGIAAQWCCDPRVSLRLAVRNSFWNCKSQTLRSQDEFAPCSSQLALELQNAGFAIPESVCSLQFATRCEIANRRLCDPRMSLLVAVRNLFWNFKT